MEYNKDVDINKKSKKGENALHLASEYGLEGIVELLIENGINLNETDNSRNAF